MTTDRLQPYLHESGAHVLLTPDLTILEAGPEFLRTTNKTEEEIIGHEYFSVFPEPDPKRRASAITRAYSSVEHVKKTLLPHTEPTHRYDIFNQARGWEERWWKITNSPVLEDGKVAYIVRRLQDVTIEVKVRQALRGIRISNYVLYGLVIITLTLVSFGALTRSNQNRRLARQASNESATTKRLAQETHRLVVQVRNRRLVVLSEVCSTTDELVHKLRVILIQSTVSTKSVEPQLRSLGFPSYTSRLRRAKKQASSLGLINCKSVTHTNKPVRRKP